MRVYFQGKKIYRDMIYLKKYEGFGYHHLAFDMKQKAKHLLIDKNGYFHNDNNSS